MCTNDLCLFKMSKNNRYGVLCWIISRSVTGTDTYSQQKKLFIAWTCNCFFYYWKVNCETFWWWQGPVRGTIKNPEIGPTAGAITESINLHIFLILDTSRENCSTDPHIFFYRNSITKSFHLFAFYS